MSAPLRLAITSNGPGEFSGWVRPLVHALGQAAPDTEVTLFFVPDDYATGAEPDVARRLFPNVRVVTAREYLRFALGGRVDSAPARVDMVQYLGGDLMHAARVHARLGGRARSYKFSRARYNETFERVYALDGRNLADLERSHVDAARVEIVGNLAIDGAAAEADGAFGARPDPRVPPGSIIFMPGTRRAEVAYITAFYLNVATRVAKIAPQFAVAFAISPFTTIAELNAGLERGGHPSGWSPPGRVVEDERGLWLASSAGGAPVPVVRDAMFHARSARVVLTIPGTKCIELASLGVPAIVTIPANAPENVVINGPLQYLDRVPLIGTPLKRAIVMGVDRRFPLTAQPNIDTGEMLMPELRGTLMAGEVARRLVAYASDDATRLRAAARLRDLYADHRGAAARMASSLLAAAPA